MPKIDRSAETVDHRKKTMNYELPTTHSKVKLGFTLIELLVVISVIGILAAFAIASFSSAQARGRDARRKSDLDAMKKALQMYYNDNQKYPLRCDGGVSGGGSMVISTSTQPWIPELTSEYFKNLPVDPINIYPGPPTRVYQYQSKNVGTIGARGDYACNDQYFVLGTHLENYSDPQINWDFAVTADFFGAWFVNYVVGNP